MRKILMIFLLIAKSFNSEAETVSINYTTLNGETSNFQAVLRIPKNNDIKKAVVILHHSGGWNPGTTRQYADLFESQNFITLEPIMFARKSIPYEAALPEVFASLDYLAGRNDVDKEKISLMGLSYGGLLTTIAATDWVNAKLNQNGNKFNKYAPLYPLCWVGERFITRNQNTQNRGLKEFFPDEFMDKWIQSPMLIFSGGKDNYDNQDPSACQTFIDLIPDQKQRQLTKNIVFPNATHAWDQNSASFYSPNACKGIGCNNVNQSDPVTTEQVKKELLKFFQEP